MKIFLSIALSIIILLGNMGLTMATHYCGGHAVETKVTAGNAHVGCGMEEAAETCKTLTIKKKSCCKNEFLSIAIKDDFHTQPQQLNNPPVFPLVFVYTYSTLHSSTEGVKNIFPDTSPPLLNQSRQALFQTFLI